MKAEIIAVGTELLLGSTVNTNAAYIGQELSKLGIGLYRQTVVGDNVKRLKKALSAAFEECDLVITTGGLGPTQDDLTKETACEFFGQELVLHQPSLDRIMMYFKGMDLKVTERNKKQALFPETAVVLENNNGTAPGAILEKDGKRIVVLPGPPNEMKPMFELVKDYLKRFQEGVYHSRELKIFGMGESTVVEIIADLIDNQTNPTIAPYAGEGEVKLRITASADDETEAERMIEPVEKEIRTRLGGHIYGTDSDTIESKCVELLIRHGLSVATAESCSGGRLAAAIVDSPGASRTFLGGFVTYSNEEKMKRLNVSETILQSSGAVSEECALQMALGAAEAVGTDIGISTTGIAGPDGGTDEKPVGTVYIAVAFRGETTVQKFFFRGNRDKVRTRTVKAALKMIIECVRDHFGE
ncbi:MAG TPA: competence/damage-inducible protein A [Thermotogota bacterium]|nr:competence/damage-inducible protein A [Thermotogota bacterium]HPJ89464.1 competence/damage-inducible protein A [Thermotogota bacterium]HPR96348.1 competence/damage-inducible protein A [Thermotogota bacterium]